MTEPTPKTLEFGTGSTSFPFTFPTEFGKVAPRTPVTPLTGTVGAAGVPDLQFDPYAAYQYLDARRQNLITAAHQRPLVRLWDENHDFRGVVAQEISVEADEIYSDTGSAEVVIRKDNWLSDFILFDRRAVQDLHLTIDPIPSRIAQGDGWKFRWGGKITTVTAKRDSQGLHTITLGAVHNREHLKHILAAANPVLPPELQDPKMYLLPLNIRTGLSLSLFINLARQYFPLLSIPDNVFNPFSWLGTTGDSMDPLSWPIQPQFVNGIKDTSRFEVFASRWTDFHTAAGPILEDAGCIFKAYTFIHGEDTVSPHVEMVEAAAGLGKKAVAITNEMTLPTRTCIILAVEDKSGIVGPTGTFADGALSMIAATADDLLTDVLIPQYATNGSTYYTGNSGEGPLKTMTPHTISSWFKTAPAPPWVVFRDGMQVNSSQGGGPDGGYSGIIESQHTIHGSTAKTVAVGGKSPGWVNDSISFAAKYALAEISAIIEYVSPGGPTDVFQGAWQAIGTPGLDALYTDQLSDTVAAYQRWSDPLRELWSGDMGFLEDFETGTGTAWTVSGVLALRAGQWKTRDYTSYKCTVRNAAPYIYGTDYTLGDRVGYQMDETIFVDQVASAKFKWDSSTPVNWEISVGTNVGETDPVSTAMRALSGIWNLFAMYAGASDLF